MKRILITGGDGVLGRSFVKTLRQERQTIRIMSRKTVPGNLEAGLEWAQADVVTGEGIEAALQDVHTIVNCMSNAVKNTYETDVAGLQRFLAQASQMGVQYLVHISIIGIDRIILPYYQYKLASELLVIESGIPYMISRIAQFYYLMDYWLSPLRKVESDELRIPVDMKFQAMSEFDAAKHLTPHIIEGTYRGRFPDFGGAKVMRIEDMAKDWLAAQGIQKTIQPATDSRNDMGLFNEGFVNAYNSNPEHCVEGISWQDYLKGRYGS